MEIPPHHPWPASTEEAFALQLRLASQVVRRERLADVRLVAGVDVSAPRRGLVRGAVVLLRYPELDPVEQALAEGAPPFPYIPGLLSFRESPVLLAAFARLQRTPDLILVDGQGIAHPRRCGIASHLGLILGLPTIGCAKSRLIGHHGDVGPAAGDYGELLDGGEVIGAALRRATHAAVIGFVELTPLWYHGGTGQSCALSSTPAKAVSVRRAWPPLPPCASP